MANIHPELPQSIEAERATLGSVFLNRDAITAIAAWLVPEMFYLEQHALIYAAMLSCYRKRIPPDTRLVCEALRQTGHLDKIGGIPYLADLSNEVPTSHHVEYYAREVMKLGTLRALIMAGGKITALGNEAFTAGRDYDEAITNAQSVLAAVTGKHHQRRLVPISEVVGQYFDNMDTGVIPGTPTGLIDYDEITGGLRGGDLIILGARPSVGKTSLALSLIALLADTLIGTGQSVLMFSLEMGRDQINERLISMRSGVNLRKIRQGVMMNEKELAIVATAAGAIHDLPLFLSDDSDARVEQVRSIALQHAMENPPALIVIDYLQLMSGGQRTENRTQEVSEISRGLKKLAMELKVPVIALSQLSRAVESRQEKRPVLSDLRESGSLEQDADQVMFLYRDELYNKNTNTLGIAELNIAKHRNGPLGTVLLRFDATTTRFHNLSHRTQNNH